MAALSARNTRRIALGAAALVGLGAVGAWQGSRAVDAADDLAAVRDQLRDVAAAFPMDGGGLQERLGRAHARAADARAITGGVAWAVLAHAPLVGDDVAAVRELARAAEELSGPVADELLRARAAFPKRLGDAAPYLTDIAARIHRIRLAVDPFRGLSGRVGQAAAQLAGRLDRADGPAQTAAEGARLLPGMFGSAGPRRYFLAFQTNAEARGTGGLVGAYAILATDHGRVRLERLASDDTINAPTAQPVVDLGPEFRERYGYLGATRELAESNLSPHFPYAARIWTALWQRRTGQTLDGAIAVDPVGLARLLAATGPITLPDSQLRVTADNLPDLTEHVLYSRFPQPAVRKRILLQIASALAAAGFGQRPAVPIAVLRMVKDGRLRMWSSHPDEERFLQATPLGGVLSDRPGPYAQLVVNNAAANKLDYYLNRTLDYELSSCRGGAWRNSLISARLTDTAPSHGLPGYVTQRLDAKTGPRPSGSTKIWASIYAADGAVLRGAWQDGRAVLVSQEYERSHPVYSLLTELLPGKPTTLELRLAEPCSSAKPVLPVQPLARPQVTRLTARGIRG